MKIPKKKFSTTSNMLALYVFKMHETEGGLLLPDNTRGDGFTPQCRVIAAGPECKYVKEGDTVLISGGTRGVNVWYKGDKYIVTSEDNVLGILPRE